jgi:hypothetical protein
MKKSLFKQRAAIVIRALKPCTMTAALRHSISLAKPARRLARNAANSSRSWVPRASGAANPRGSSFRSEQSAAGNWGISFTGQSSGLVCKPAGSSTGGGTAGEMPSASPPHAVHPTVSSEAEAPAANEGAKAVGLLLVADSFARTFPPLPGFSGGWEGVLQSKRWWRPRQPEQRW